MALSLVAVSAQVVSTTTSAAATLPSGYTTSDLLLAWVVCKVGGTAGTNDTVSLDQSWALIGSRIRVEVGSSDLFGELWYKVAASASETAPTVTVGSNIGSTSHGWSVVTMAVRGEDTTTPFDGVTPVTSSTASFVLTFVPTGITTGTANAFALSFAATSNDTNIALDIGNEQGFTEDFGGIVSPGAYDTTQGTDHAVGGAHKAITSPSAVTMPTWAGNDTTPWVALSCSVREATAAAARVVSRIVQPSGGRMNSNYY